MSAPKLSDLARVLGLNIATVSRGLRNDPRVRLDTRQRIFEEAERQGYRPNVAARALAEGRTRTIWFVIPDLEIAIAREPAWHASHFLLAKGYDLLLAQHHNDEAVLSRILERASRGGADGAILLPDPRARGLSSVDWKNFRLPFVFLDRRTSGVQEAPVVTSDNAKTAYRLVERHVELEGASPDLVVNGFNLLLRNSVEVARQSGVSAACRDLKIPEFRGQGLPPSCRKALVLASSEDDTLAILKSLRLEVLVDFAVFDAWHSVPLPGCRVLVAIQDFEAMARVAVERLLEQLAGADEGKTPREDLIPMKEIRQLPF
jgi:DNA-binding LacI/PurR family transcriptional regulator